MYYFLIALLSAFLFGASTPIGKILLDSLSPFQLSGLLYLGGALGILPFSLCNRSTLAIRSINQKNKLRLIGAIVFGGVLGPVLLLFGLEMAPAASVSMWLNLELVFTAVLGFLFFREHLGVFGWLGALGTIIASVLLSWHEGGIGFFALMLVAGAGLCWGFDNHLTALIDTITPSQSTFWKGIIAGSTNLIIGLVLKPSILGFYIIGLALIVGIFAYGFSISLYIYAAQNLGAIRSQMVFASAPFFGVLLSVLLGEPFSFVQTGAAILLLISLVSLFRDSHSHYHTHEIITHKHKHCHDDNHHGHQHGNGENVSSHTHWHTHEKVVHTHFHFPDVHHRHKHEN